MLDDRYRQRIEEHLGRALEASELGEPPSLNELTEPHLALARQLRRSHLVLCVLYLQGIHAWLATTKRARHVRGIRGAALRARASATRVTLLSSLASSDLESLLRRLDLKVTGSKSERIERLLQHFSAVH